MASFELEAWKRDVSEVPEGRNDFAVGFKTVPFDTFFCSSIAIGAMLTNFSS